MNFRLAPTIVLLAFALAGGGASAEQADRDKPMNIEADSLRYDDVRQTSVFTGNVVITKGTIVIRGARVDVRQDPEGYQYGVVTAAPGKRAFYRQKREGVNEFIEGEGEVIEYDSRADNVKFIRQAQLRRYNGARLNDEFTGALIVYDNGTDLFTVDSAVTRPGSNATAAAPGGRIRAMLTPKSAAQAPATPPAQGTPGLQPSTGLSGAPQ